MRKSVYESVGTHRAIAMRPDDDMKLGKLIKGNGFRQGVAYGTGLVRVEWHDSLAGAIRGLGKSAFPGLDYRLDVAIAGSAILLVANVLPFPGLVLARGRTRLLYGCSVLMILAVYAYHARRSQLRVPPYCAALHPLGVTFFVYAVLRSAVTILARGGVEWRGTKYPLESLRDNSV